MCIHKLESEKSAFSLFFLIFYQNYEPRKKFVNVILTRTVMELIFDSLDFGIKKNGSFLFYFLFLFLLLPDKRVWFYSELSELFYYIKTLFTKSGSSQSRILSGNIMFCLILFEFKWTFLSHSPSLQKKKLFSDFPFSPT